MRYVKKQKKNIIINAACVNHSFKNKIITLFYQNLATKIHLNQPLESNIEEYSLPKDESKYRFDVEARTLDSIIDDIGVTNIDFISIDVEGYELEVIQGLNFNKINVNYILVETNQYLIIAAYLFQFHFDFIEKISHHDYLFKRRIRDLNP